MRHFGWQWIVINSVIAVALAASAQTRPQYGGIAHVAMRAATTSLDPADRSQVDLFAGYSLTLLMFDTLVTIDENGGVQPSLAASWQLVSGQRWQLRLRTGIKFHDGSPLTGETVAASLRATNPSWNIVAEGNSVSIDRSDANLLAELALPRNAIAKRTPASAPSGTGPFHIVEWLPGKKLSLAAEEECWRGRPFLDAIEIEMGKSFRDQLTALQIGKADLVEVAADQTHRLSLDDRHTVSSSPMELWALVFVREAATPDEKLLREALAWSVERRSISNVLLQGAGQVTASILPNWMSGYGFVFPTDADLARARHAREQVRVVPTWALGYDASDSLARLLAERISLNAKDAGLSLQPTSAAKADLRLMRIPLASSNPWVSLEDVAGLVGIASNPPGKSVEDLYASENGLLATQRIVPLLHLPVSYASASNLKNWALRSDGSWRLADAWLGNGRP